MTDDHLLRITPETSASTPPAPHATILTCYFRMENDQWELLPHDFPPPGAVKYYFYLWRDEGIDQTVHDLLRW
ncbi:hypothetical protein [Streptomyces sp. NBC_01618]|uniref:hypothetical protein n=1 Tax=Streptomyces sp. NBC_01618 TaxID=2975900 RepID=UPI00386462CC